ncbi:gamma-glutamyl-gamma-aminobutyrate hydrolase family protein [Pseudomonadota bacterium]
MTQNGNRPLIGVISDRRMLGDHPFHMVGEKYLRAIADGADAYPVALPLLDGGFDVLEILDRLDGIFLTGSPSNVEPHHYMGDPSEPGTWHDPHRDLAALALIPAAIRVGMPLLAVCRGFQEMNVAFGGSLHQMVHTLPEYGMHKENPEDPLDVQYSASHAVSFSKGGLLEKITGRESAMVNSLHSQGIDRLGDELEVEAVADDGLIEGFSVRNSPGFTLAVQWHPEWKVLENPVSSAIFSAYGAACRAYGPGEPAP